MGFTEIQHGVYRMKTYLRVVNPVIAVLVLLLCLWAAANDEGFKPMGMLKGSIPTYFVAKGLFCSSALFILGKILSLLTERSGR